MTIDEKQVQLIIDLKNRGYTYKDVVSHPDITYTISKVKRIWINRDKICLMCGIKTYNYKFCSTKCSGNYNNKPQGLCLECKIERVKYGIKYCELCKIKLNDKTLGEIVNTKGHRCNAHTLVRDRAKNIGRRDLGWGCCRNCGYNKHIEIAHIRPVSSFSDDTRLSVVNHVDNLMPLCRNCHWEFDHDMLDIDTINNNNYTTDIPLYKYSNCIDCEKQIPYKNKRKLCQSCATIRSNNKRFKKT